MRRYFLQYHPQSLTGVLSELSSSCLTGARGEEGKALCCFPPQDRKKNDSSPDDCRTYDTPPMGSGVGTREETPGVADEMVAGLGLLFINRRSRVWPKLKVAFPLEHVNLKLFLRISDNHTNSGPQEDSSLISCDIYLKRYPNN